MNDTTEIERNLALAEKSGDMELATALAHARMGELLVKLKQVSTADEFNRYLLDADITETHAARCMKMAEEYCASLTRAH